MYQHIYKSLFIKLQEENCIFIKQIITLDNSFYSSN